MKIPNFSLVRLIQGGVMIGLFKHPGFALATMIGVGGLGILVALTQEGQAIDWLYPGLSLVIGGIWAELALRQHQSSLKTLRSNSFGFMCLAVAIVWSWEMQRLWPIFFLVFGLAISALAGLMLKNWDDQRQEKWERDFERRNGFPDGFVSDHPDIFYGSRRRHR
jgi:chromate transport protein ChrA